MVVGNMLCLPQLRSRISEFIFISCASYVNLSFHLSGPSHMDTSNIHTRYKIPNFSIHLRFKIFFVPRIYVLDISVFSLYGYQSLSQDIKWRMSEVPNALWHMDHIFCYGHRFNGRRLSENDQNEILFVCLVILHLPHKHVLLFDANWFLCGGKIWTDAKNHSTTFHIWNAAWYRSTDLSLFQRLFLPSKWFGRFILLRIN